MISTETTTMSTTIADLLAEKRTIEADIRDLREAIDDCDDIGQATRLRGQIRAKMRRLEEIEQEAAHVTRGAA